MSKKVYTVTCTWAPSYGAVLQAYALATRLRMMGYDASILNYQPKWGHRYGRTSGLKLALSPLLRLSDFFVNRQYVHFLKQEQVITEDVYRSSRDIKSSNIVKAAFIVGSDQVWNCAKYYNGKDDSMFLAFAKPGQKKISYAASLAMSRVPNSQKIRYKKLLDDFADISVREETGKKALSDIGIKDVKVVIDPVFLLPKKDWSKIAHKNNRKTNAKKYVLVICLEERKELHRYAADKAALLGAEVYVLRNGLSGMLKHAASRHSVNNVSVPTYLELIARAECVVTDSFHAMAFSLIFERNVDVIPRTDKGNSRMTDLLSDLGISSRITTSEQLITSKIDFKKVKKQIDKKVHYALSFLEKNLENQE